MYEIQNLNTV